MKSSRPLSSLSWAVEGGHKKIARETELLYSRRFLLKYGRRHGAARRALIALISRTHNNARVCDVRVVFCIKHQCLWM